MASKYTGVYPSVYKTTDYQKKIADEANRLAYTGRPKTAHYPEGHPTPQFKTVFNRLKGTYKFWSDASRKTASCDVDVATVAKNVYDKNFPWGLWQQKKYMNKHPEAYKKVPISQAKPGDIGHYTKKGIETKGHTFIIHEGMKIKEGSAKNWFFSTTNAKTTRLSMEGKKSLTIYRAVNKSTYMPLKKGSKGEEVKRLQRYLNWYLGCRLKIDGDFGKLTEARVKSLQKKFGLKQDGIFGSKTLAKAKEATK